MAPPLRLLILSVALLLQLARDEQTADRYPDGGDERRYNGR